MRVSHYELTQGKLIRSSALLLIGFIVVGENIEGKYIEVI